MAFQRAYASGAVAEFKQTLADRLLSLARDTPNTTLVVPVGLFLVLDENLGGDSLAKEIVKRFNFLDLESRNVVDFYFLGWQKAEPPETRLTFDLNAFQNFREVLGNLGVKAFGGNADLLLVDAHLSEKRIILNFKQAVHIDLSAEVAAKNISSVGGFLQGLIQAASEIKTSVRDTEGAVFSISDRLGIAVAKESILQFILKKWGAIIGASQLGPLVVREVGPQIDLSKL